MPEENNFQLLSWLIHIIGADILVNLLNKKLDYARKSLETFLYDERHTLFHAYQKGECCQCITGIGRSKTFLYEKQWNYLYVKIRPACKKNKKCSCQYDVNANVSSSEFDITLSSSLLFKTRILGITPLESCHITRIRKYRNDLVHNQSFKISDETFPTIWDDAAVSIIQLARVCSLELAVQTDEQIKLAKTAQLSNIQMTKIFTSHVRCLTSIRLENERRLTLDTSASVVQEVVQKMTEGFAPMLRQTVSYDIDRIRGRLTIDEYKTRIVSDMAVLPVIDYLKCKGFFSVSDEQHLLSLYSRKRRSEEMLQKILSKDDTVVDAFMQSLLATEQDLVHDFILGNDYKGQLRVILESDFPLRHPAGEEVAVHIILKNRIDLQSKILEYLRNEEEEMNDLTMMFAKLSLRDVQEGSIIIHLKTESPDAIEEFQNAFHNGKLRGLIEEILKRAGVLDQLIYDQVTVVVKIAVDEAKTAPSSKTFYEQNWEYLVEEISPRPVAALLKERGVLDDSDIKEIFYSDNLTRFAQTNSLIYKLNTKGNDSLTDFKQCLSMTSQEYILRNVTDLHEVDIQIKQSTATDSGLFTDKEEYSTNVSSAKTAHSASVIEMDVSNKDSGVISDEEFDRDEDWSVPHSDLLAIAESGIEKSIAFIQITGEGAKLGSGFLVGGGYIMTAYHSFRDKIDHLKDFIGEHMGKTLVQSPSGKHLSSIVSQTLGIHFRMDTFDEKSIKDLMDSYFEQSLPEIDFMKLLSALKAVCNQDIITPIENKLKEEWEDTVKITFAKLHRHHFSNPRQIESTIPFANAANDVLILKLKGSGLEDRGLELNREEQVKEIYIVGYPKDRQRRLMTDIRCPVHIEDAVLERNIRESIKWWSDHFPDEKNIDFAAEYEECNPSYSRKNGRAVIHASRSFTNGASGSPMFFIDKKSNRPVVNMMYLRGYPGFFYEANSSYCEGSPHLKFCTNAHVPFRHLFAVGITMDRIHNLLVHYKRKYLLKAIFKH